MPQVKLYPSDRAALQDIKVWIEANPSEMYSLKKLCMESGLNSDKLKKGFKSLFGMPVYKYHVSVKMNEAKKMLAQSVDPISQIGFVLGYEYVSSFCNEFKKFTGESPARFRNKMQPELFVGQIG